MFVSTVSTELSQMTATRCLGHDSSGGIVRLRKNGCNDFPQKTPR